MPDNADYLTKAGWTLEDIAKEVRSIHNKILTKEGSSWEDLQQNQQERWLGFVEVIIDLCEREVECRWESLTERAYAEISKKPFNEQNAVIRAVWIAATRHAVNIIMCEDQEDVADLKGSETFWKEWVLERVENDRDHEHQGSQAGS